MKYRYLDAGRVSATIDQLEDRIRARFPEAGLALVCHDLAAISRRTSDRVTAITRPHWPLRALLVMVLALSAALAVVVLRFALSLKGSDELSDVVQGIDAAMNVAIVLGATGVFVATLEARMARRRALAALHEIRSIVHVIDMHQLTKDPSMIGGAQSSASPGRDLTPFELMRYLDYCSEMLSLSAKIASLYAQRLNDSVVVDTVGDIERLTAGLSSKIWQKITIVQNLAGVPSDTSASAREMKAVP